MTAYWVQFGVGIWLILTPWILGFHGVTFALWNSVLMGLTLAALNLWALFGRAAPSGDESRPIAGREDAAAQ